MLFSNEDHYLNLGYRFNPFEKFSRSRFAMVFPPGEDIQILLEGQFDVLQLVGGCGSGKTSTLLRIREELKGENFVFHAVSGPRDLPTEELGRSTWILIDEAQKIRKRFALPVFKAQIERGAVLIIGSHMDHQTWFKPDVQVKTVYLKSLLKSNLRRMIENRLEYAAITQPSNWFSDGAVETLAENCRNSLELARAIGYEIFLNNDLPEVIGRDMVRSAAEKVIQNTVSVINFDSFK